MRTAIACLPLLVALAACASPPPGGASAAAGTTGTVDAPALAAHGWRLAGATDAAGQRIEALFPEAAAPLQFSFADGRIAVSGGCNRLSAAYTLEGGTLQVGPVAQTKMFCGGGALMAADEAVAARLQGALSTSVQDGRLVLSNAGGDRLVLEAAAGP